MTGPKLFWSWPVWAKLSFVLGNSLLIVVTLAGLVKLRKSFQIRKLTKAQAGDCERAEIRERVRSSDEIPFGARAMVEDPHVEGLWNSRASTPLQSPILAPRNSTTSRISLNLFSRSRRNSSISSLSHLNLPDSGQSQEIGLEAKTVSLTESAAASALNESALASKETVVQVQPTPRRRSGTIKSKAQPGLPVGDLIGSDPPLGVLDTTSARRSLVSTDPNPSTPTHERRGRTLIVAGPAPDSASPERTPTTRKALDRMEAHRRFHAAESGQLQARTRNTANETSKHKHTVSDNVLTEQETARAVSWPITSGEVLVDFNASQNIKPMNSPQVVPFRAFVEMHPPPKAPPKAPLKPPPSAWTERTQGLLEEKLEVQAAKRRITIKNNPNSKTARDLHTVTNDDDIKDESEDVSFLGTQFRRINSGFEVLPAGSLQQPTPVKDFGCSNEPQPEATRESKPRKLKKRNR